jgi:hypothetical protein
MPTFESYNRVPPERRVFVKTAEELASIVNIRATLPPDARILWVPYVWRMANYYIYPRKVFQAREYKPGEQAELDPAFLKSRRITHIFVDEGNIYPVKYGTQGPAGSKGGAL